MPKIFTDLRNTRPVNAFIDRIINKDNRISSCAYLVKMSYYYDWEKPSDPQQELILFDENLDWYWLNDWFEGQQNVKIYAVEGINEFELQDNIYGIDELDFPDKV